MILMGGPNNVNDFPSQPNKTLRSGFRLKQLVCRKTIARLLVDWRAPWWTKFSNSNCFDQIRVATLWLLYGQPASQLCVFCARVQKNRFSKIMCANMCPYLKKLIDFLVYWFLGCCLVGIRYSKFQISWSTWGYPGLVAKTEILDDIFLTEVASRPKIIKLRVKILTCWGGSNANEFYYECRAGWDEKIIDILWIIGNPRNKKCRLAIWVVALLP